MIALMRKYIGKLRLLLVAGLVTVSFGCGTWEDYRDSRGAGKADSEVAIFKAHLENTRRIVSASDGHIEYQYNPAQERTPWSATHPRVRLLPGQYTITAKTWPFNSLYEFEVDLKAGHIYKVETFLCNFECRSKGKPYRHDRWIQDLTTRERISGVVSECYLAKSRQKERRKVPCPDEEDDHDSRSAGNTDAEVAIDEVADRSSQVTGKATAVAVLDEDDVRGSRSAGNADAEVAIFKAHPTNTRRIVRSDGRIEYPYHSKLKRTQGPDPHTPLRLLPGQYTVTVKTWPFGSLYEFEVDLKAGHIYEVETSLCAFDCISTGEPYRHDRWVQDLTTGERISGVVSECYLGKKRQRERQRVPCPDNL